MFLGMKASVLFFSANRDRTITLNAFLIIFYHCYVSNRNTAKLEKRKAGDSLDYAGHVRY
jgi:hypothetical protein